ncbi:MAG TPA: BtrH N-terminal domain-containing protein [Mobilitalea sp.]|nr:BtrH N-terminal domain-containing protein [Mobilitalea sp.]
MEDKFQDFKFHYSEEFQYLCMKNAFCQMLSHYGYENPILYLKTGFELKILKEDQKFSLFRQWQCNPFFEMEKIEKGYGDDFEAIFTQNCKEAPVILLADVFYLPYRSEYQKFHASHFILLFDYNEEQQKVGITDWYAPHFFQGYIDYKEFKRARASQNPADVFTTFSGKPIHNYWYRIPKEIDLISPEFNYELNVKAMFLTMIDEKENIYGGIEAFAQMKKMMEVLYETEETEGQKTMQYYHDQLFIYYRTSLFAKKYFGEVDQILGSKDAAKYQEFCKLCCEILNKLNMEMNKASVSFTAKRIDKVIAWLNELETYYYKYNPKDD